jgi:hypothetical protein
LDYWRRKPKQPDRPSVGRGGLVSENAFVDRSFVKEISNQNRRISRAQSLQELGREELGLKHISAE